MATKRAAAGGKVVRRDGRKAYLVYLDPEVIKAVKKAAVDDERHGYRIVEEAIRRWLAENKNWTG